ncbi:hypothetical protein J7E93_05925 [Streptomyces sp. ISL-36]|uniref:hypothetical protein n=1 Tax=Streptomyces sp. ISL-36 TaxID=2819182 RepID=UPI001BE694C2|nr:hypothetical protein [Streptomyces sp. ISL-36]MBT2439665.1 hypothetical protein [Streptomyces sp. ISL-36]
MRLMNRMGSLLAALGLAVGALFLAVGGPAAAEVVEPFGARYDTSVASAPAFSVPVPDRETTGTASPREAKPGPARPGPGGSMAKTGSAAERLWLLGGLALALAATGVVAKAALRGRRDL